MEITLIILIILLAFIPILFRINKRIFEMEQRIESHIQSHEKDPQS